MKIEPRHNLKKPSYAVAASLIAAAALVSGCGSQLEGETQSFPVEGTTQVGSIVDPTDDLMIEGDISIADDCFPYRYVPSGEIDLQAEDDNMLEMFRGKVSEIESEYPGIYSYSITSVYDADRGGYFYVLTAWDRGTGAPWSMVISDGEWGWFDDDGTHGIDINCARSYEDIQSMPFLFDTKYLIHPELAESGMTNVPVSFVENTEDGLYSGRLIAINEDGSSALLLIGEPITFERSEIEALDSGDLIGLYDLRISDDLSVPEDDYTMITLDADDLTDLCLMDSPFGHDTLCLSGEDGICIRDPYVVEVPLPYYSDADIELGQHMDLTLVPGNNGWFLVDTPVSVLQICDGEVYQMELCFDDECDTGE